MPGVVIAIYAVVQVTYLACLLITLWLRSRPVDLVDLDEAGRYRAQVPRLPKDSPEIIVLYPVLDELEATMRTAMLGFARAEYPGGARRVIAIPNANDHATIGSLQRIQAEYPFLEILQVPPTADPSWAPVWKAWESNDRAYWWHIGKRRHAQALPPKKTRQLVYALYVMAAAYPDALLSYLDADSVVPADYFVTAAVGMRTYDVIQNTNIAGNGMASWAASMFAMDHMGWDGSLYQHMSAGGRHPYYVLGKGLFFRVSDLLELGGFNPWLTIEDPEVGMRFWTNGRRLGIVRSPLIEEVPETFRDGIIQRKRWVAGFFQSLGSPLTLMGMSLRQRLRARLNLVPCLSLLVNPVGVAVGIPVVVGDLASSRRVISVPLEGLSLLTIVLTVVVLGIGQYVAARQTRLFLRSWRERASFMLRVNPLALFLYWIWWSIPMAIGFSMYVRDKGQRWERTRKVDANHDLVRQADGEPRDEAFVA